MTGTLMIRGANVLDVSGGSEGPLDVHVVEGTIAAVGVGLQAESDTPTMDGEGLWLMPGVFDCHLHLGLSSMDTLRNLRTPITLWALQAGANALATLKAGVTSVRDAGGIDA